MADPLSITSGILAVLQLASRVVQYLNAVREASNDKQRLVAEIGSVTGFLYLLKDSVTAKGPSATLHSICLPDGPLDILKSALSELASKLCQSTDRTKKAFRALIWPFQKSEVNSILYRIERQKTLFGLALQNDSIQLSQAMAEDLQSINANLVQCQRSISNIEAQRLEVEREKLLTWISPLDFQPKHFDVINKHHPGTGKWMLETSEFVAWRKGETKLLWCTGIPGAGKTVLASIIISSLETVVAQDEGKALAYIYCSYQDPEHVSRNLIASILRQLVGSRAAVPERINNLYKGHSRVGTRPSLDELLIELQAISREFSDVFIVVDALDECTANSGDRLSFLEAHQSFGDNVHLLITSRNTINVCDILSTAVCMEIDARDEDIVTYIQGRMISERRLQRNVSTDEALQAAIVSTVVRNTKGMFLMARLHLDSLAKKHNRRDIKQALHDLPKELYSTYDEAMKRIMSQDADDVELARNILIWVLRAARPLTIHELQHAIAVQPGSSDLDNDALVDEEVLVCVCLGLIAVEPGSGLVRLIHYTAQEYFRKHPVVDVHTAEKMIAKISLSCLAFDAFACPCDTHEQLNSRIERYPLLWYVARWWGVHLRLASDQGIFREAAIVLTNKRRSRAIGELMYTFDNGRSQKFPKRFTGLHLAARFGVHVLARLLLEVYHFELNQQDEYGQTALSVAARWGHTPMVSYLLELLTIDVDAGSGTSCGSALHAAVRGGHQACIEALIRARANVAATTNNGHTPLHIAAEQRDATTSKYLLSMGANPEAMTKTGITPVYRAAQLGSVEAVEVLVLAGGQVNRVTGDNWTPLHIAVENNHVEVVQYLLSRGVDVSVRTIDGGQTPLEKAVLLGHQDIITAFNNHLDASTEPELMDRAELPLRTRKRSNSDQQDTERRCKADIDTDIKFQKDS